MTKRKDKPQDWKIHQTRREQVLGGLLFAALVATTAFGIYMIVTNDSDDRQVNANDLVDGIFYENVAQCEADMQQQYTEYAALQEKYQKGELSVAPKNPPMQVADCAPQMQAAQEEHNKTAPVYASVADCTAEGVRCESTPANHDTTGYRPVYGGTYLYPYASPNWVYVNYGGSQYRVYEPCTVYQSSTSGMIVTPYGHQVNQTTTGRVVAPRHTSIAAPSRPAGTTAKGTIRGRSSQGFGSSFKSTGGGGK
jgi:uncharacterized protein YgiB involved in biofilm formation